MIFAPHTLDFPFGFSHFLGINVQIAAVLQSPNTIRNTAEPGVSSLSAVQVLSNSEKQRKLSPKSVQPSCEKLGDKPSVHIKNHCCIGKIALCPSRELPRSLIKPA